MKVRQFLQAKFWGISCIILSYFAHLNANPLEFDFELSNKSIDENKPIGTKIGSFTQQSANPNKLGFKILPDLPPNINPVLWLDASDLNWASTQWDDRSGNNNHATMHGTVFGYPTIKQNAQNGHSVMNYSGDEGNYHSFSEINDIRTVFWVLRKKTGYGFMLAHNNRVHFHFKTGQFFWEKYASPSVYNGKLSLNGQSIDGTKTDIPNKLSIISLRTTGNVTANNFSNDRNIRDRFFNGELGELIIFNHALSDIQIKQVESYLHFKWELPLAYDPINQPFSLSTNDELLSNQSFDRESLSNYEILVRASDNYGNHLDKKFNINILNVIEDLDSDGVEDPYDSDIDGDGLKNSVERNIGTDPATKNDFRAINKSPIAISSNSPLKIIENRPTGTIIGNLQITDPDTWNTHNLSFTSGFGDTHNHLFSINQSGTLKSSVQFDFESNSSTYYIRVRASDDFNATIEESLSIELVNEDTFSPLSLDSNLMLWLDASDRATLDRGEYMGELGTPEDGNATLFWGDKSGNEHHAIRTSGSPTYLSQGLLGLPTLNTDGDEFTVSDSNKSFDAWNEMTIFAVFKWTGTRAWKSLIEKNNSWNHTTFTLTSMNPAHLDQGTGTFYGLGDGHIRTNGGNVTDARDHPVALSLVYDGTTGSNKIFGNGVLGASSNGNPTRLRSNPETDVKIGNYNLISEILIFNDALDDSDRQRVEGHLAHKWNLLQELDDYHPYKNGGMMDGSSIAISEELPIGTPIIQMSELDPDYNASWTYSLTEANDSNDNTEFTFFDQASFDHLSTEGLSLWLDAADTSTITADQNGNVSRWADKSSNEYNATAVSGQFPVSGSHTLNGKNVLSWSSNKKMISNVPSDANWQDCYIVARWSGGSTFPSYNSLFTGKNESSFTAQIHSKRFQRGGWVDEIYINSKLTKASDSVVEEISQPFIISFSSNDKVSANGYVLGADRNINQRSWVGEIAEVLSFDRSLNSLEKKSIESYLANKWGLIDKLPELHLGRKDILLTRTVLDYETNASSFNIRVRATANGSVQNEKKYKIYLSNVVEDLDDDGIEDHYDLDDDGDGFSDLIEIAYPSDPRDATSLANVSPNELNASASLTISEDTQIGSLVTTLSASDPDGDQNVTFDIAKSVEQLSPLLWLDANHPSASSAVWVDKSSHRRDAIRYNSPTIIENVQNGLSVMRYETHSSSPDYHEWDSINNIRTVVAVLKRDSGSILSNSSGNHFWSASTKILHWGNAHVYLREGMSRLNGLVSDATITDSPSSQFFLLSFVPTGNVSANRIGRDRSQTNSNYHFDGDYGELLLFDEGLKGIDLLSVEHYLAQKWGLLSNLNSTHPFKDANHTSVADNLSIDENGTLRVVHPLDYETDSNYSILASVSDSYGYSYNKTFTINVTDVFEDFDGDTIADHLDMDIDGDGLSNADEIVGKSDPYNSSSTNRPPNAITSSNLSFTENLAPGTKIGEFNATDPEGNEKLTFWLEPQLPAEPNITFWLDASLLSKATSIWSDKSGNENHAKKFGNPKITKDSQTGLSLMEYNGNEQFHDFENITDIRTVFWVVSQKASVNGSGYRFLLCGNTHSNFHNQNDGKFWGNAASKNIRDGSTRLNGNILSGNTNYPNTLSIISLKTTGDVQASRFGQDRHYIGRQWIGYLGELIIYSSALSNEEIQVVEGYLAHKWGLVYSLPNNHPWRNNSAHLFTLDTNGTLAVKRGFNYETDDQNYSLTVRAIDDYGAHVEGDFTIHLTNVLEDVNQDGVEDYDGNQSLSPTDIAVMGNGLKVTENAAVGSVVGQVKGVDPDGDAFHSFTLSTSGDPNRFHSSSVDGLTAWFDASDLATIQKVDGTNQLSTWRNKVDYEVYLRPSIGKEPDANGSINGLNAVEFTAVDQISKRLWAYKNGANWNPMGVNGAASGKLRDGSLYMTFRSNKSTLSGFPFNFGWEGHFPWNNNLIFWVFSDIRRATNFSSNGEELMLCFEFSASKGIQKLYKNGTVIMSGPRTSATNIGGAFFFPSDYGPEHIPEWTVGEMLVVSGITSNEDHLRIEGYLAHKWGLGDTLPDEHLYSRNYQSFDQSDVFLSIDNNGTLRTATTFDHEVDSNLSITIRVIDDEGLSFDKNFTIEISNIVEADLDGDGIEDLHDLDTDGDGVSNILETIYGTDSQNKESYNLPPHSLSSTNDLVIMENQPVGTVVGKFQAIDPQGNDGLQFSMPPRFPSNIEPLVWLDGEDELSIHLNNDFSHIKKWANKAGKHHDFVQSNKAYQPKKNFDNLIKFVGDDYLHSEGSLNLGENFSIIMVAEINLVDSEGDALLSYGSKYGGPAFQLSAMNSDGFYARFINYNAMGKNKTFLKQPQSEVSIYELIFSLNRSKLEFYLNGYKIGDTAYTNAPSKNHTFRLFTNNNVNNSPTGSLGEVLIIRKALDNNERNQIESYLGRKWNVQVQNTVSNDMFEMSNDGTLYTTSALDFERDKNVTIKVKAFDRQGLFIEREFIVKTQNLIEDRDGDGIEDAYDYDNDNDGIIDFFDPDDDNDGFSDNKEFYWGTDSFNRFSFAYVPMVKTIGHQTISSGNYLLKGEILTNGGAPIIDAGMSISEDVTFRSFDKIQSTQWNGKIFSINYQTKTKGTTLYFRAYAENGVGTKNGGLRKIIIPVDIENRSLWSDAEALQGGWVKSPWFGIFKQFPNIDWVYHNKLKWVYINELEDNSIWLWNKRNGWRWTQKDVFPYLFRWRDAAWIYLHTNPSGGALYYNTKSQSIEIED